MYYPLQKLVYISTSDLWQVWGAAKGNAVWNWIGKNVCPWHNLNCWTFYDLETWYAYSSCIITRWTVLWNCLACILKVKIQCHRVQTDFPLSSELLNLFVLAVVCQCISTDTVMYESWCLGCCQGQGHRSESSEECFFCSSWILVAIKTICKQAWYADTSVLDSASCEDVLMTVRSQWGPYFQQNDCPEYLEWIWYASARLPVAYKEWGCCDYE